jgi:hypothetical protein
MRRVIFYKPYATFPGKASAFHQLVCWKLSCKSLSKEASSSTTSADLSATIPSCCILSPLSLSALSANTRSITSPSSNVFECLSLRSPKPEAGRQSRLGNLMVEHIKSSNDNKGFLHCDSLKSTISCFQLFLESSIYSLQSSTDSTHSKHEISHTSVHLSRPASPCPSPSARRNPCWSRML